jgi:hypothetical protein
MCKPEFICDFRSVPLHCECNPQVLNRSKSSPASSHGQDCRSNTQHFYLSFHERMILPAGSGLVSERSSSSEPVVPCVQFSVSHIVCDFILRTSYSPNRLSQMSQIYDTSETSRMSRHKWSPHLKIMPKHTPEDTYAGSSMCYSM